MNLKVKHKEVPKKKPKRINEPKYKQVTVAIEKKIQKLKIEKNSLLLLLHSVSSNTVGDWQRNKTKFQSFSPKMPQMQPTENPRRLPKLQK